MNQRTEAEKLLTNQLLPRILDDLQSAQVASWLFADTLDKREYTWNLARAINTVREHINERAKYYAREGTES